MVWIKALGPIGWALSAVLGLALPAAASADSLKVALVMPGPITDGGWNQAGYEGLLMAQEKLGAPAASAPAIQSSPRACAPNSTGSSPISWQAG